MEGRNLFLSISYDLLKLNICKATVAISGNLSVMCLAFRVHEF